MTTRRWLLVALAAAAVLLFVGRALSGVYVDYRWYQALGAAEVWRARMGASIVLLLGSWVVATLFVFANLFAVRHSVVTLVLPRRIGGLEIGEEVPGRYLTVVAITISVVLGALLTIPLGDWSTFLAARSHAPFGERDPYLDVDLGFFVYWLPFELRLYTWTLISMFIVTALVLFLYALTPSLRWERGTLYVSAYVRRHVTVLAGVLLAMLAWSYRLDRYTLLSHGSGPDGAFTAIDHVVALPGSLILALVTLGAALVVIWSGWTGQIRMAFGAITGVLLLALIVRQVAPFAARRLDLGSVRQQREGPYLATRAGYTRRAFGVDRLLRADSSAGFASIAELARGVSVWDPGAITVAVERSRPVTVTGSSLGWHGTPAGVVADVPERVQPRGGWVVSHVLGSAADERGGLVLVAARGNETDDGRTLPPPVLVSDSAGGFVIVSDSTGSIAGARLDGALARISQAWSQQRPGLLFTDLPQPRPTVVDRRDLRERLAALAPFFTQGTVVTPIVLGDSLLWAVDLYAASSTYPLSRRIPIAGDARSYFQHAATALVNASTGAVRMVADSALDPVARTWVRRFPSLFTTTADLPPTLRAALPPPIDGAYAQAVAYGRYGTRNDSETPRHLPPPADGADSALITPDAPFVLPDGRTAVALPLVADQDQRVRGAILATGGATRGTMWLPLAAPGPRWASLIERLRAAPRDTSVAGDAPLVRGAVRAVPVAGELVFLQTEYAWRPQSAPSVARVTLAMGDSLRSAATLAPLVGVEPVTALPAAPVTETPDLRGNVDSLYRVMRDALRRGDFRAFGEAFDALGRLLGSAPR